MLLSKTPARVPKGHVSTGHADSPATIVVGRAHKKAVVVGAAPRVVTNTVLIKKRMKMDEDLTGNFFFQFICKNPLEFFLFLMACSVFQVFLKCFKPLLLRRNVDL